MPLPVIDDSHRAVKLRLPSPHACCPQVSGQASYHFTLVGGYRDLGFVGCSSHSGRRTFITNAARKISTVGGSLRDVQMLAGHTNLRTTQRYIDANPEAQVRIVELV